MPKAIPTRSAFEQDAAPPPTDLTKCRRCDRFTPQAILANHGGWCVPCYDAYCRTPDPQPVFGDADHRDTQTQREMRRLVRPHARRNLFAAAKPLPIEEVPPTDLDAAKRETEAKLAAYLRANPHLAPRP